MRDRLGERHAVAFEARRQHEQVGVGVQRREALIVDGAGEIDAVAETMPADRGVERRRWGGGRGAVGGEGHAPRQVAQRRQCLHQHVVAFAPHHGADREQRDRPGAGVAHGGARLAARQRHGDALGRDRVIGRQAAGGRRAGHDHPVRMGERRALAAVKLLRLRRRDAGLERERVMHQRHQRMVAVQVGGELRQHAEGKAVDHDRRAGGHGEKARARGAPRLLARPRKLVADICDLDRPAEARELGDHAAVIRITAGRGGEIARHREHEAFHRSGPRTRRAQRRIRRW